MVSLAKREEASEVCSPRSLSQHRAARSGPLYLPPPKKKTWKGGKKEGKPDLGRNSSSLYTMEWGLMCVGGGREDRRKKKKSCRFLKAGAWEGSRAPRKGNTPPSAEAQRSQHRCWQEERISLARRGRQDRASSPAVPSPNGDSSNPGERRQELLRHRRGLQELALSLRPSQ